MELEVVTARQPLGSPLNDTSAQTLARYGQSSKACFLIGLLLTVQACATRQIGRRLGWEQVFALRDGQTRDQVVAIFGDPQVDISGTDPRAIQVGSPVLRQYDKSRIQIREYFSGELAMKMKWAVYPFTGVGVTPASAKVSHLCFVSTIFVDGRLKVEELDTRLLPQVQDGMTSAQLRSLLGNPVMTCGGWFYFTRDTRGRPVPDGRNIVRLNVRFSPSENNEYTLSDWYPTDDVEWTPDITNSNATQNSP
jgi:outer membrane protein assembly factor BamE (lipoprotein component of BamABCDE complex)